MSENPRVIQRVLKIGGETPEERQAGRAMVAANLATVLEYAISEGLIKRGKPHPSLLAWERFQRHHITQHMRLPQNMLLSETERITGGRIDRLALQCCEVVRAWVELVQYYESKAYRQKRQRERELERKAKLERRRAREQEKLSGHQPRIHTPKEAHHEEVEHCVKCGKRRAVRDHLCGPCLDWERAKLGRE